MTQTPPKYAAGPSLLLEDTFRRIQRERMADLPFINPALLVEAVGFTLFSHWLGILITPWSMNLLMLPGSEGEWAALHENQRQQWRFPAGNLQFVVAREDGIGIYQQCPLFNTMSEFPDQDRAREAAMAALHALLTPAASPAAEPAQDTLLDKPLSKRDFLRGRFFQEKQA